MLLRTKLAKEYFLQKKYQEALNEYEKLAEIFGDQLFKINIELCRKKLLLKSNLSIMDKVNNFINIAFITDVNYAMATYVAISTIIENSNKYYVYNIYIIAVDMLESKSNIFYELKRDNININIISEKSNDKFLIKKDNGFHVSPAAIIKFDLPHILSRLNKLLYLDGDIVARSDLVDIYKTDITDNYASVVEDMKPKYLYKPSILKKLNIESHNAYFNSGVMLLNLKKLRNENISKKLYEYRENGKNFFMDQDSFNVVFKGIVKYFHPKNNFLTTNKNSFKIQQINSMYKLEKHYDSYAEAYATSHIVHFSSKNKPWNNYKTDISKLWFTSYLKSEVYAKFGLLHKVEKTIDLNNINILYTCTSSRYKNTYKSILSILEQSIKIKNIILISNEDKVLPSNLIALKNKGLIIIKKEDEFVKNEKKIIIDADDEIIYKKDWLLNKLSTYLQTGDNLIMEEDKYIIENYKNYKIKALDTKKIDIKIKALRKASITEIKREQEVIVNLTSFPERMKDIKYALYSLLTQTCQPDRVILWLSYEENPNGIKDLPQEIIMMIDIGLEIEFCHNLKVYNKLIHSLKKYPHSIHITADDDIYYSKTWLEGLYSAYKKFGNKYIYAYRMHKVILKNGNPCTYSDWEKEIKDKEASFSNFLTGVGGVLYPANIFNEEVLNKESFLGLSPRADDIWYWSMAVLNSIRLKVVPGFNGLVYVNPERELRLNGEVTLAAENVRLGGNDVQLKQVLMHYPKILNNLQREGKSEI